MDIPAQGPEKLSSARTVKAKSCLALFNLEVEVFSSLIKAGEEEGRSAEGSWWWIPLVFYSLFF